MPGKMTLAVYDDVHHTNAEGIELDLWRVNNSSNRTNIKHETITANSPHVLLEPNTAEEIGSFEIVLYVKDYFDRFNEQINVNTNRYIVPFGMSDLNRDCHLNVHITPNGYTCTL